MRSLLILTLLLLLAAPARAGTYEHHTLSATSPGLDGWSPRVAAPGGFVAATTGAGGLSLAFWARPWFAPGDTAEWTYTAAADTTVADLGLERAVAGLGGGDWNTLFGAIVDGRWRHVAYDVPSVARSWGRVAGTGLGADRFVARLACGGPHACVAAGAATLQMRAARVVLHDGRAPTVSTVQGDLAEDRVLSGTAALSFAAADRGGGVYRALAEVDGVAGPAVPIGDGRCRDLIDGGDPYQFAHRRPCPLDAGAAVAVDTTRLADGRHVVAVWVEDAAGNRTAVFGPAARTVANAAPRPAPAPRPPVPAAPVRPGVVVAWLERGGRRAASVTARYGERVRVRGRVTDAAGRPLAGSALAIAEQVPGRTWTAATGVRTLPDGRFTAFTRIGPSRRLRITAPDGARGPLLTVRVRAPVTVRALRRGGAAIVRGRLRGGHVPRGGALVELQARSGRWWVTHLVVRTWSTGRFGGRLERVQPGRLAVRARVPRQAGLPFAAGLGRAVSPPRPPRRAGRTGRGTSR